MQLVVTGRHVDVTEAMKIYAREKLGRVLHERPHINEVHLIMDVEKYRHRVELSVHGKNLDLFCREETADMYSSIDRALAKLDRQLCRYKERRTRGRRSAAVRPRESVPSEKAPMAEEPYIEQRFTMKPMYLSEALLQMASGDHIFLAFLNADTGQVNMLNRGGGGEIRHMAPRQVAGPDRPARFQIREYDAASITADAAPRLLRKEDCLVNWEAPAEALAAMVAAGDTYRFFMCRAARNGCVVYRKLRGAYALIEPKE